LDPAWSPAKGPAPRPTGTIDSHQLSAFSFQPSAKGKRQKAKNKEGFQKGTVFRIFVAG
jgi:hypothetical protein